MTVADSGLQQFMLVWIFPTISSIISQFTQIFYKTGRLRVVVSTANLIEYDWQTIENVSTYTGLILLAKSWAIAECLVARFSSLRQPVTA